MSKVIEDMRQESLREGLQKGLQEGLRDGRNGNMKETALRMLAAGKYALDEISTISGLSIEEVKKLSENRQA